MYWVVLTLPDGLLSLVELSHGREDEEDGGRGSSVVDSSGSVRRSDPSGKAGSDIELVVCRST